MNYEAKLMSREELSGGVTVFCLEKPEGFQFSAGQWCFLSVPASGFEDDRGLRRPLSIASSPLEKELLFATKLSESAMKRTMAEMTPGTMVTLGQPMGNMILPQNTVTPLVFLAGGIGITPFRSMCCYAAGARTAHSITLFYSSRKPDETPFLDDLQRVSEQHANVSVVITMTRVTEDEKIWSGPRGRLSADTIKSMCAVWEKAAYYVAGPPAMADTMKEILNTLGISTERVKVELFAGA
jgi:ferredoxin-NADP reductase